MPSPLFALPKPRTILHIDGDAFFASCEQARNPRYKNLPVVTGGERGIVSSMSYEAKALGIPRGLPIFQLRKQFPQVIVMSSNFEVYEDFSDRIAAIVGEYTPDIERYSIDEAFADLTGWDKASGLTPLEIGQRIKDTVERELDITVSIGISTSKVLAKVGSKHQKPNGLVHITEENRETILGKTPIGNIWGIGPRLSKHCLRYNIFNAQAFAEQSFDLVRARFSLPTEELWHELNGRSVMPVNTEHNEKKSLTRSHTFHPATMDQRVVFQELLGNLERVLLRARRRNLLAKTIAIFIKSQDYDYHTAIRNLDTPSAFPNDLTTIIREMCNEAFRAKTPYRATGVTLHNLVSATTRQQLLFGDNTTEKRINLYHAIDQLTDRHGKNTITIAAHHKHYQTKQPTAALRGVLLP